jgi:hypothetical protein
MSRSWRTLCLTLLLCTHGGVRGDWPHLRGPACDGVAVEVRLAESWPAGGPRQRWSRDLGQGHSGIVIAGGRLFTQYQSTAGQYVLCLDPHSGELLWQSRIDRAWQPHGAYPGPYATPTASGANVYFASPTGLVGCLSAETGDLRWSRNVRADFGGRGTDFGFAATPLVEEGRVIFPVGGLDAAMVALDAGTGELVWKAGGDAASYCPAFPITVAGRRCIVGYLQNALLLVDAKSGQMLYRQSISTGYDEHSAWPLYREPNLLLTAPFRNVAVSHTLEPRTDGSIAFVPRWTSKELSNDVVSSVLYRGHVFGFDLKQPQSSAHRASRGSFKCLEWTTGKLCWATDQVGHASVVAADGKLLLLNDTGTLILAKASPERYEEQARLPLFEGEICWTPPTLWNGLAYVRSPSKLVCLEVGDQPEASSTSPPAVTRRPWRFDGSWLVSREREYPNDAPSAEEAVLWYGAGLAMLVIAGAVAMLARQFVRPAIALSIGVVVSFALGLAGTNLLSSAADRLLFTWPVSLYAAFGGVVHLGSAVLAPDVTRGRWFARLGLIAFLAICLGYFWLCRFVGLTVFWAFLFGFPFAAPFTLGSARCHRHRRGWLGGFVELLGFSAFYWAGIGLLAWKNGGGN